MAKILAFIGTNGGVGNSCVAGSTTAALVARGERCVLVDLDAPASGIEVLLGIEGKGGTRWAELADARGEVDGQLVIDSLPRWESVPVLSASRLEPTPPSDEVVLDVCSSLLRAGYSVVLDLPRPPAWSSAARALLRDADALLLTVPCSVAGAAGLVALGNALRESGIQAPTELVVRRSGPTRVDPVDLSDLSGLQVAAAVGDVGPLRESLEQGRGPLVSARSRLARAGQTIAARLAASPALRSAR